MSVIEFLVFIVSSRINETFFSRRENLEEISRTPKQTPSGRDILIVLRCVFNSKFYYKYAGGAANPVSVLHHSNESLDIADLLFFLKCLNVRFLGGRHPKIEIVVCF